jgi:hypothetical protein
MKRRQFLQRASLLAAAGALGRGRLDAAPAPAAGSAASSVDVADPVWYHNVARILPADDGEGVRLCRLPAEVWKELSPQGQKRSFSTVGCELRFNLKGPEARVVLKFAETRGESLQWMPVLAEVAHGPFFEGWTAVRSDWTEFVVRPVTANLAGAPGLAAAGFDPALFRVLLPMHPEVRVKAIIGDVSPVREGQVPRRRYLAYGSSITNGFMGAKPSEAYPARVGRLLGVDACNIGLGGSALLEPAVARYIAGRTDWDFASLEMGINLLKSTPVEEFKRRVEGFVPVIARAHPDKWLFCIDLFTCFYDFQRDPKIAAYREVVREAVARLASPKVVHVDGRELLADPSGLSSDLLHPYGEGFVEIAGKLAARMQAAMGPA